MCWVLSLLQPFCEEAGLWSPNADADDCIDGIRFRVKKGFLLGYSLAAKRGSHENSATNSRELLIEMAEGRHGQLFERVEGNGKSEKKIESVM